MAGSIFDMLTNGYDPSMLNPNAWMGALKQNPQTQQGMSALGGMTNAGSVPNSGGMPTLPTQANQPAQQNMLTGGWANSMGMPFGNNMQGQGQSQANPLLNQTSLGGLLGNYYSWGQANGRWGNSGMY